MTFNTQAYLPKPRDWFTAEIKYEGHGRAEFADPQGWVEGQVHIEFDVLGHAEIVMEISDHYNSHNSTAKYSLNRLLSGQKPDEELSRWEERFLGPKNTCTSFVVTTPEFTFTVVGQINFQQFYKPINNRIIFYCWQSHILFRNQQPPKYWVMPLINFVPDFGLYYQGLNTHPLRLYDFPEIPDDLTETENIVAHSNQQGFNALIVFECEGNQGFIERLPDFPQKKEALKNLPYAVTALMNCEIDKQSTDIAELWKWFPIPFLDLLSLATGTRVSTPWIEFRDEYGDIVSRLHVPQWSRRYVDGHHTIHERIHYGIGSLLTQASASKYFRDEAIADVVEQLILSTGNSLAWADRIAHLARAIDTMCWEYGHYKTTKLKDYLDLQHRKEIETAIKDAVSKISSVQTKLASIDKNHEAKLLDLVIGKLHEAKTIESGFGTAIYGLIQTHDLPDAQILDSYFSLFPIKDGKVNLKNWGQVLAHLRGKSIHHISYLKVSDISWDNFEQVSRHLHDVIVRVLFKMLGYTGQYQPLVVRYLSDGYTPDWVTHDTPASKLGFKSTR